MPLVDHGPNCRARRAWLIATPHETITVSVAGAPYDERTYGVNSSSVRPRAQSRNNNQFRLRDVFDELRPALQVWVAAPQSQVVA
jgi:hypothetical protein